METLYEISYLLSPTMTAEEAKSFALSLETKIGEEGGIVKESTKPIKGALAYPIKKQRQAWTGDVIFGIEKKEEKLKEITSMVENDTSVLRFAFMKVSDRLLEELRRRKEASARAKSLAQSQKDETRRQDASSPRPLLEKEEKVEVKMEEVEKKIEELLE